MSENQQQNFEDFIKNRNTELHIVDQKYSNKMSKANYTTDLIINSIPSRSMCTDANTNIQDDMNLVRNCLDNRLQMDEQAIDALLQGKHKNMV